MSGGCCYGCLDDTKHVFQYSMTGGIPKRSLIVALIVGTILTLINHGAAILSGQMPVIWKVGFTYLIPFLVSMVASSMAKLNAIKTLPPCRENGMKLIDLLAM